MAETVTKSIESYKELLEEVVEMLTVWGNSEGGSTEVNTTIIATWLKERMALIDKEEK